MKNFPIEIIILHFVIDKKEIHLPSFQETESDLHNKNTDDISMFLLSLCPLSRNLCPISHLVATKLLSPRTKVYRSRHPK